MQWESTNVRLELWNSSAAMFSFRAQQSMKKAAKKEGPQPKEGPSSAVVLGIDPASVNQRCDIRVTLRGESLYL
jgi:hypothetical protein